MRLRLDLQWALALVLVAGGASNAGCSGPIDVDGGMFDAARDGAVDAGLDGAADAALEAGGPADGATNDSATHDAGSDAAPEGCSSDAECATPTPVCDSATGACVECTRDEHCAGPDERCDAHACVPRDTVLLLAPTADGVLAASRRDGTWTTTELAEPPEGVDTDHGGGLAVTGVGHGVAVLPANSGPELFGTSWDGGWTPLTRVGTVRASNVSEPAPATGGALLAYQALGSSRIELHYGRYDDAAAGWTVLDEPTGAHPGGLQFSLAIVADASGSALAVLELAGAATYGSTTNAGGAWGAVEDIPNAPVPPSAMRGVAAVRRAGSDQLVAALRSGTENELRVAVRAGAAWSPATTLATDLRFAFPCFALAALPDGRVALVYQSTTGDTFSSFFDGAAWSPWALVPIEVVLVSAHPISIARGIDGEAVLELAYVDRTTRNVLHTRLSSSGEWSEPRAVGTAPPYASVHIAVGP